MSMECHRCHRNLVHLDTKSTEPSYRIQRPWQVYRNAESQIVEVCPRCLPEFAKAEWSNIMHLEAITREQRMNDLRSQLRQKKEKSRPFEPGMSIRYVSRLGEVSSTVGVIRAIGVNEVYVEWSDGTWSGWYTPDELRREHVTP